MHIYTLAKVFLCNARISVDFDFLVIFLYAGKPYGIKRLDVKLKDNFGMVICERLFFKNPIAS